MRNMVRACVFVGAFVALIALLALASTPADAITGFDLSVFQGDVSQSSYDCLKKSGYNFGIIQVLTSPGTINPHAANDLKRAKAAGIEYLDAYIFLNFRKDPAAQTRESIEYLRNNGAPFGQVWFDIEAPRLWGSCAENQKFFAAAVKEAESMGVKPAIYSSASQWAPIMCGYTGFSHLPLWYAHYDGRESFSDFSPFGGWSRPNIKQFQGTTSVCGTSIDKDWY